MLVPAAKSLPLFLPFGFKVLLASGLRWFPFKSFHLFPIFKRLIIAFVSSPLLLVFRVQRLPCCPCSISKTAPRSLMSVVTLVKRMAKQSHVGHACEWDAKKGLLGWDMPTGSHKYSCGGCGDAATQAMQRMLGGEHPP